MFYVYVHRKATTGAVFYVGKGTGKRFERKEARNNLWAKVSEKHGVLCEIVHWFEDEALAFRLEMDLIAYFGRVNNRTGCLVNMTDGGEGSSGQIQSDEKREKLRIYRTGRRLPQDLIDRHRERMKGFRHTPESRAKIGAAHRGKTISPDHIEAVRRAQKGKMISEGHMRAVSKPVRCIDTGQVFASQQDAAAWVRGLGLNCSQGSISNCCRGQQKMAAGYRFEFVPGDGEGH